MCSISEIPICVGIYKFRHADRNALEFGIGLADVHSRTQTRRTARDRRIANRGNQHARALQRRRNFARETFVANRDRHDRTLRRTRHARRIQGRGEPRRLRAPSRIDNAASAAAIAPGPGAVEKMNARDLFRR